MKKTIVLGTIFLALVVTVVAAFSLTGRAFAQAATPTATPEDQTTLPPDGFRRGGRHGDPLRTYQFAAEAEAFGLTTEALQALYDEGKSLQDLAIEQNLSMADFEARLNAARQAALAQAVADGAITQEQADAFAARQQAGRPARPDQAVDDNPLHTYLQTALADAFGLSVEALDALEADGKTLKDLAIEQDLTVADFQAKMESAHQAALDQAVADGIITQEQADAMKDHRAMRPGEMGHGGKGHRGGGPGRMPGGELENAPAEGKFAPPQ
jgi:competence protein ComGC